jgi:hypothetical protein
MTGGKPPSNAQCKQRNNADPDHQHHERYGIVIEPVPTLYTHDAASPYKTNDFEPFFFPTVTAGDGLRLISRADRQMVQSLSTAGDLAAFATPLVSREQPAACAQSSTPICSGFFYRKCLGFKSHLIKFLSKFHELGSQHAQSARHQRCRRALRRAVLA